MEKKTASAIMLTLLLTSMLTLAFNIHPVKAEGTIYIRADGSIDPSTTPISTTDNITYTLIDDIYDSIVIERDNIVVEGAGHEVRGTGLGSVERGICLDGRGGVTIRNATISNFEYGIWLNCSSNNSIAGNNITENVQAGIFLFLYSSNNSISGNNMTANNYDGITLYAYSSNNTISGNNIANNYDGIALWYSSNNTVSGNVFFNDGLFAAGSYDNVVVDNSVNGKPLVYLENVSDCIVDDAGQVILINCNNIIVENLNLSHATVGVDLWGTKNTKIAKNNITGNNRDGIYLGVSSNNTVYENNIANNGDGINLYDSSNNTIYGNNITDNDYGIWLFWYSSNNTISGNNIANNYYGIWLYYSSNNFIFHNSLVDNTNQVYMEGSANIWDDGYPSGGNYWSDYTGVDADGDGIGDTPYIIDMDNQDLYPLMHPWSPLPVHNINTGLGYATIQEAINAPETLDGHTIFVEAGTYYENVFIGKAVSLIGENRETTIIDGSFLGTIITVSAGNVSIRGFTIRNSKLGAVSPCSGIYAYANGFNISHNIITNSDVGIWLEASSDTISNNTISNNTLWGIYFVGNDNLLFGNDIIANEHDGVILGFSSFNRLVGNHIANNQLGIQLYGWSSNNLLVGNNVTANLYAGIYLGRSPNNMLVNNNVANNGYGIEFYGSSNNTIYHNNFINNNIQAWITESYPNVWDDGYPSGGNYWSDYAGVDVKSGPCQDLHGSDGIGDVPYVIDANNTDHYPLMYPYGAPPPQTYTLTIAATVGGTTGPAPRTYNYTANSTVQVTAIPEANYLFDYWELDDINVGSANPYSVYMDKDHTLKAVFSPVQPPLSVSASPLSASILAGQSVTFTSTVSGGYTPYSYQWYLNGAPVSGATSASWTFTPTTSGIYYIHLKATDAKGNTMQSGTARITVATIPVGGYSYSIQFHAKAEPILPYIALIVALTIVFTRLRPKTKRKR